MKNNFQFKEDSCCEIISKFCPSYVKTNNDAKTVTSQSSQSSFYLGLASKKFYISPELKELFLSSLSFDFYADN